VLVTRLSDAPRPGSDEIAKACEEAWVGAAGYRRADGSRQARALAFQGRVVTADGRWIDEVFVVDLPEDPLNLLRPDVQPDDQPDGGGPLAGTESTRPRPPAGVVQRRLTHTADRKHPGLQGPRHWLRSSPDGSRIAFLMRDDAGIVQVFTVSPAGGPPEQLSHDAVGVASGFTWTPDGRGIACVIDGSVCLVDAADGTVHRLTEAVRDATAPRPEACVVSPDGRRVAFVRAVPTPAPADPPHTQLFVVDLPSHLRADRR